MIGRFGLNSKKFIAYLSVNVFGYRINQVTVNTSYKYIENESHILRDCTLASKRVFAMPVKHIRMI